MRNVEIEVKTDFDISKEIIFDTVCLFDSLFSLLQGTLSHRKTKSKVDDETLRFIRQKRPRLQCKRRNADVEGEYGVYTI